MTSMNVKKKSKKQSREHEALIGLIELYLKTGKPIGSSTLQENGFEKLSTATLRNYFAELEKEGYLKQPHISGGRIPTNKGLTLYAEEMLHNPLFDVEVKEHLQILRKTSAKDIVAFLQKASDLLSDVTGCAAFLSAVRFDHDFILDVKFITIDPLRLLCVIITNFGQILSEVINLTQKMGAFSTKRIEAYFHWKLKNLGSKEKPAQLSSEEEVLAQKIYSEIMVRYLVRYTNFSDEEILRTGFSKLLAYPEFSDPLSLTSGLSLFENSNSMRKLLGTTKELQFWIGSDLNPFAPNASMCSVISIPYKINHIQAGALAILGPCRIPYRQLFGTLTLFSEYLSETLTKTLHKFKLTYRQPSLSQKIEESDAKPFIELKEKT